MRALLAKLHRKYPALTEIFRFLVVGGIATAVDMLVMALVQYAMEPALYTNFLSLFTKNGSLFSYIAGTACGFTAGLIVNYVLSVLFVFEHKGKSRSAYGFIVFALLSLGGLALHILGMYLGNGVWELNAWAVKIVMTCIVLVYNYISKRLLLFRDEPEKQNKREK